MKKQLTLRDRSCIFSLMNTREERALDIANRFPITAKNGTWTVPSQNGAGKYAVLLTCRFDSRDSRTWN